MAGTIVIGQVLAHYRIIEKLGEGGMGVVWRARDTRLDREVAIKVLPDALAADAVHLERFEREARTLAALDHRNIAGIYGLEEAGGRRFLVMELIAGEDLARRLARGPLAVEEALEICEQLASALEAAHDKGVLHRDLKPANVLITHEGRAKVLDFGLAKVLEERSDPAKSPTLTCAGTRAGTILGTAGYMSPEQARGKLLDKRTDIWSFGCVLFECLTGRSPFDGETVSDTLAAILKTEPDWKLLPPGTPQRVVELLQRCLDKDPRNRLRDAGDARIELQRALGTRTSQPSLAAVVEPPRVRSMPSWAAAATLVLGLLAGAALWALVRPRAGDAAGDGRLSRLSIHYPQDLLVADALLSPDGSLLVARAQRKGRQGEPYHAVSRRLDSYAWDTVAGSEGAIAFTFSPDGRWLALVVPVSPGAARMRLSKVPVDGRAPPLNLTDWHEAWNLPLVWLPDGDLLVTITQPAAVVRIPADGGAPKPPVELRKVGFEGGLTLRSGNAAVLPDGRHVLARATTYSERGYEQHVAVVDSVTGEVRILVENGSWAQWSPTGHLLFSRHDALLAAAFDPEGLTVSGGQIAVIDGMRTDGTWTDAPFQIAADGTLMHWPGGAMGAKRRLYLLDENYVDLEPWSDDLRAFEGRTAISDNGARLAVTIVTSEGLYDIWVSDLDLPRLSLLVHEPGADCIPHVWSRDGTRLLYSCHTTTSGRLFVRAGDGREPPRLLLEHAGPTDESFLTKDLLPDESQAILMRDVGNRVDLFLLPLDGTAAEPDLWLEDARAPDVSPDGRWIAYESEKSGRNEVYLRSLGPGAELGPEIPVTREGGGSPTWYTGKTARPLEVRYYHQARIYSVEVSPEPRLRISQPRAVSGNLTELELRTRADPTGLPDGRSMLVIAGDDEQPVSYAQIVRGWFAELRQRTR